MINLNPNVGSTLPKINPGSVATTKAGGADGNRAGFEQAVKVVGDYLSGVDELQQSSNISIKELLTGKNSDITSVVSAAAKADMSFKLLVGVRNKLVEAYKQTMNMPL